MIEIVGDLIALRLCDVAHAGSLGQVLSQQAVEVLVAAALPRVVRRGEVHGDRKASLQYGVVVELRAIVERERLEVAAMATDRAGGRGGDGVLVARRQLLDDGVAGLALDQSEDAMAHIAAHDGVTFPVAQLLAKLDLDWALVDATFARQHAARVDAAVSLASEFAHDARVPPQVAPGALIPADAAVDGLVTDVQSGLAPEHAGDLHGAPLAPQQLGDQRQVGATEVRLAATPSPSCHRVAVRLRRPVIAVVTGRVAAQFPRDRAAMAAQRMRNLCRRVTAAALGRNQVSFFLGELVIRHGCNPFPGRMRKRLVSPLPTSFQRVLHLPCESAMPNPAVERTRRHEARSPRASARRAAHLVR